MNVKPFINYSAVLMYLLAKKVNGPDIYVLSLTGKSKE